MGVLFADGGLQSADLELSLDHRQRHRIVFAEVAVEVLLQAAVVSVQQAVGRQVAAR